MAKNKNNVLPFGQMPFPENFKNYRYVKLNWGGLNKRNTQNSGMLSQAVNVSTEAAPYLSAVKSDKEILESMDGDIWNTTFARYNKENLLAVFGFGDKLYVTYYDVGMTTGGEEKSDIYCDILACKVDGTLDDVFRYHVKHFNTQSAAMSFQKHKHSMVKFRVYDNIVDVTDGQYIDRVLLFPEKVSLPYNIERFEFYSDYEKADKDTSFVYAVGRYEDDSNNNGYYVWNGTTWEDKTAGCSIDNDKIIGGVADKLDVDVRTYYNDGYEPVTNNDGLLGYAKSPYSRFCDNYEYYPEFTNDGENAVTVYVRDSDTPPYIYSELVLTGSATIKKCYFKKNYGWEITNCVFYERDEYGDFSPVKNLNSGDDVSGYYIKKQDNTVYYERKQITSSGMKEYEYTKVDTPVSGETYYVKTDIYTPPQNANKKHYYKNEYTSMVYAYIDGKWVETYPPSFPNLEFATVHLSRLFGVAGDKIYVSGYNDYANWLLDTVTDSNESNAWVSTSQSNTDSDGNFTGITTFQGHVVCFKNDFQQEVYNNQNPFKLVDIGTVGAVSNSSIQNVNNNLYFVSENDVWIYTGSVPKSIGKPLNITRKIKDVVSGCTERYYHIFLTFDYNNNESSYAYYVYDTYTGYWTERKADKDILMFAKNDVGLYYITNDGYIYLAESAIEYSDFEFETDISTALYGTSGGSQYSSIDIKHINRINVQCEIADGASFKMYLLVDDEEFNPQTSMCVYNSGGRHGNVPVRVKVRRSANYNYRLHFVGKGNVIFKSLELQISQGGELLTDGTRFIK